jgi:serine/threonine-protein kinase
MSPEQARGSARVDVRSDIYAVGALLYKLLTGKAPFPDEDPATTLRRVLSEDPRRPRELDRSIPQAVELLIQRAMARSPSDRPASALELERELAQFDERAQGDAAKRPSKSQLVPQATRDETATLLDSSLPPSPSAEMARRAKGARPAALGLAFTASLIAGIGLFVVAATALLLVTKRAVLIPSEKVLLGVITGIGMLLATGASMGALVARWRSAWAIERLARGLRIALLTLLALAGLFGIGWRGYCLLGPPVSAHWLPFIDIGIVAVPMLVSTVIFVAVIRKAQRHS